ncbi:MAG: winged helix-turn-helix transcriptional regulator [Planctomycetia bacterium]|nr:winged helix-turn-helix transcriptional regulator [Planctomycetia bacterium]RLT12313.1 MAG: winged helix-turn-helix transcriptional regulator [Planctomycetota bacterium]
MRQKSLSADPRSSDTALIDLLRVKNSLGIGDLSTALGVTATAVRQRLDRLMRAGIVGRSSLPRPRGRPSHAYSLTEKGQRTGSDNFRDLAMVLWSEVRSVKEPSVRQGLLSRIGSAMAGMYRDQISGSTAEERLESIATLFRGRQFACDVNLSQESSSDVQSRRNLAVLTTYSCPYPELAEQDRGICSAERLMLQELVGTSIQLSECRLDGASCCRFTASEMSPTPISISVSTEAP